MTFRVEPELRVALDALVVAAVHAPVDERRVDVGLVPGPEDGVGLARRAVAPGDVRLEADVEALVVVDDARRRPLELDGVVAPDGAGGAEVEEDGVVAEGVVVVVVVVVQVHTDLGVVGPVHGLVDVDVEAAVQVRRAVRLVVDAAVHVQALVGAFVHVVGLQRGRVRVVQAPVLAEVPADLVEAADGLGRREGVVLVVPVRLVVGREVEPVVVLVGFVAGEEPGDVHGPGGVLDPLAREAEALGAVGGLRGVAVLQRQRRVELEGRVLRRERAAGVAQRGRVREGPRRVADGHGPHELERVAVVVVVRDEPRGDRVAAGPIEDAQGRVEILAHVLLVDVEGRGRREGHARLVLARAVGLDERKVRRQREAAVVVRVDGAVPEQLRDVLREPRVREEVVVALLERADVQPAAEHDVGVAVGLRVDVVLEVPVLVRVDGQRHRRVPGLDVLPEAQIELDVLVAVLADVAVEVRPEVDLLVPAVLGDLEPRAARDAVVDVVKRHGRGQLHAGVRVVVEGQGEFDVVGRRRVADPEARPQLQRDDGVPVVVAREVRARVEAEAVVVVVGARRLLVLRGHAAVELEIRDGLLEAHGHADLGLVVLHDVDRRVPREAERLLAVVVGAQVAAHVPAALEVHHQIPVRVEGGLGLPEARAHRHVVGVALLADLADEVAAEGEDALAVVVRGEAEAVVDARAVGRRHLAHEVEGEGRVLVEREAVGVVGSLVAIVDAAMRVELLRLGDLDVEGRVAGERVAVVVAAVVREVERRAEARRHVVEVVEGEELELGRAVAHPVAPVDLAV
mmetsp:Transcript_2128/g.6941  ORF Transcript_2128/g.6941 Transcript_2128/m.6941 type:complete len:799 (+) Transcript_2128:2007-4403(+)